MLRSTFSSPRATRWKTFIFCEASSFSRRSRQSKRISEEKKHFKDDAIKNCETSAEKKTKIMETQRGKPNESRSDRALQVKKSLEV